MNKVMIAGAALLFCAVGIGDLQARPNKRFDERTQMCRLLGQGRLDWESEAWGLGGKKFQEVCKSCHTRGNDKGAPVLTSQSYTSRGWNTIFASRRVRCAQEGAWGSLSEEDIQFVNDYLFRNAAWTYDPNSSDSC